MEASTDRARDRAVDGLGKFGQGGAVHGNYPEQFELRGRVIQAFVHPHRDRKVVEMHVDGGECAQGITKEPATVARGTHGSNGPRCQAARRSADNETHCSFKGQGVDVTKRFGNIHLPVGLRRDHHRPGSSVGARPPAEVVGRT